MSQFECFLCLELNEKIADCIHINPSSEQNIKNLIDKHLWPMESFKSKSSWLCLVCLEMLEDFNRFFKRIEDANIYYECFEQTENESEVVEEVLSKQSTQNWSVTMKSIKVLTKQDNEDIRGDVIYDSTKDTQETPHIKENNIENNACEAPSIEEFSIADSIEHLETQYYIEEIATEDGIEEIVNKDDIEEIVNEDGIEEIVTEDDELYEYLTEDTSESQLALIEKLNSNEEIHANKAENYDESENKDNSYYNKEVGYEHDQLIAKYYEIFCDLCTEPHETFPLLRKHFVEKHNGTKTYTICCGTKYFSRASLADHIKSHIDPEHLKYCSKILKSRTSFMSHLAWHDGKLYRCEICYNTYMKKSKYDKHMLMHESNGKAPQRFPCEECDKTFSNKSGVRTHLLRIHRNIFIKLCTICGASFRDHNTFKLHMAKHEGKPSPLSQPCDICGLILSRKQSVKVHKELKHPDANQPTLTCHVCHRYKTTCKSILKDHIRSVHRTERKHKCYICEKSFKEGKKLKEHMGIHTGEPIYTCSWCPKKFYSSGNLSSHRIRFHSKEWEEKKRQKYAAKVLALDEQSSKT